jgi:peptidoglycan/LPS O-acetylase OafA/YrhL
MIQRVQTIWMILAAIAAFLTLKFLFYSGTLISDNLYHPLLATDNFLILILTSALGTGIIINIFLFKNRKIQMRIIIIAILLECLIIFLYIKQTNNYSTGNYSLWSALHILIVIFLILAARGIYKDSKLIKESNRLR